jgi:hypothetical protein
MSADAITLIIKLGLVDKFKESCSPKNLNSYKAKIAELSVVM